MITARIILRKGREESLLRFHPWVFSGAVASVQGSPAEGDLVEVRSAEGAFLACGHYQSGSIAVRVLSFADCNIGPEFWRSMIGAALEVRRAAGLYGAADTDCFRLVHGEGDGLPGLVIDWYGGVCVMQAHSVGMFRAKRQICQALSEVFGDSLKAVYDKSSGTVPPWGGIEPVDGYLMRSEGFSPEDMSVVEHGRRFYVDWAGGQKTGLFLDQRESRQMVGRYALGRNVLNLFSYTGGFSVYALAGGAGHVDSVDSSARAVSMMEKNVALNGFGADVHTSYTEDAMDFLAAAPEDKYDLIVVDPPAFAKRRSALPNALRAYRRLNEAAIGKVAPGGLVFTFSCSQAVDKGAFAEAVFTAAARTQRRVRILDRMGQPADHAVSIYHPEGEYLKGLLLYVE